MKKLLLTLLMAWPLLAINEYPEWFIYQGRFPQITVGFSYGSSKPVVDAERLFCAYNECYAYGTLYRYQDYDERHSDYFYVFSPDSLQAIQGKLTEHDRFGTNMILKHYVSAFALETDIELPKNFVDIRALPVPEWVSSNKPFFQKGDYCYGVGMYTLQGNENDTWKTAEEKAVFNIMNGLAIEFHSVTVVNKSDESDDAMEQVRATRLKYRLKNVQVIERFNCVDKQMAYVMVRIHRSNIFSPNLK